MYYLCLIPGIKTKLTLASDISGSLFLVPELNQCLVQRASTPMVPQPTPWELPFERCNILNIIKPIRTYLGIFTRGPLRDRCWYWASGHRVSTVTFRWIAWENTFVFWTLNSLVESQNTSVNLKWASHVPFQQIALHKRPECFILHELLFSFVGVWRIFLILPMTDWSGVSKSKVGTLFELQ